MSGPIRLDASRPIPLDTARAMPLEGAQQMPLRRGEQPLAAPPRDARTQVRHLSHQLEGVFLNQLFQAMRATVPHEDDAPGREGEELFTSLLDEKLAAVAADRMKRGVGEALYRELARRLPKEGAQP